MSDEELINYYKERHADITVGELSYTNRGLYKELYQREMLDKIPRKVRRWNNKSDDELIKFYESNFQNVGRRRLSDLDSGFYATLERRGLLHIIPSKHSKKSFIKKKSDGFYKDVDNAKREFVELIDKELRDEKGNLIKAGNLIPRQSQLKKTGHSSLIAAIHRYHGGYRNFLSLLGHTPFRRPDGYYKIWDNLEKELLVILNETGTFPTEKTLIEGNLSRLTAAIEYWGGFLKVKEKMGYNEPRKIKDAPTFREFVETDETAQMFVRILRGSPAALGRALSIRYKGRLVAEDVPDYLPSLGPYLGTTTVSPPPPGPGGFGDVLTELPLEAILEDQLLRDTFLNMGREYYFSLIESEHPPEEDRQTLVEIIKANAEEAEHPSLKWLHQTLFDEFSRFHELTRDLAKFKAKINGDN